MPIAILEKPEPSSEVSHHGMRPALINSDALRLLVHELRRYCTQEVTGRSFLIAGHRGSGKTTLVNGAFQEVLEEIALSSGAERTSSQRVLRPLIVLLQGPNLLPNPDERVTAAASTNAGADAAANVAQASEMENILIQITLGLYRSLAREFARSFRERVLAQSQKAGALRGEHFELAAQLELALDEYPGEMRLRDYWQRGGFLHTGVLFPTKPKAETAPSDSSDTDKDSLASDQGFRELVALASACGAYRRICGTINRKEENKTGREFKAEGQITLDAKGADLIKPMIPLLTGGLVGAGVLTADPLAYSTASFVGILTALAASLVAKYSTSWSRLRSLTREDLFIPNLSVATLDRLLPVLIERIRNAGLAPVFVVDELDKVVGLSDRITQMVRRLKKFVAENAFFCFLTDRAYFEEMRERTADTPYSIEYTYFTNQVFVVFNHRNLHQFINSALEPPQSAASPLDEGAVAEPLAVSREASEYLADYPVLPYILLHAAQMHAIDLRRQLTSVRNSRGYVSLEPGAIRSRPRYRFELMIQVAIEVVLEEEDMQAELDRQPAFLRLVHDALYYISRCWSSAPKPLVLDEAGENQFEQYLLGRMATDTLPRESRETADDSKRNREKFAGAHSRADRLRAERPHVEAAQRRFLMESVRQVAGLLASPTILRERAKANGLSQVVVEALPNESLLYVAGGKKNTYHWRCYQSGRTIEHDGAEEKRPRELLPAARWTAQARLIDDVDAFFSGLSGGLIELTTLSSQFGIISTTPAWADVKRALGRLRSAQATSIPYPEQDADIIVLDGFHTLLLSSGDAIAFSVLCGAVIGSFGPLRDGQGALHGLKLLSETLLFRNKAGKEVTQKLRDLATQIRDQYELSFEDPPKFLTAVDLDRWRGWVENAYRAIPLKGSEVSDAVLGKSRRKSWGFWLARLRGGRGHSVEPRMSDLICMAASAGPSRLLKYDLDAMTVNDWSAALLASLTSKKVTDPNYAPPWVALAALQHLGFEHQIRAADLRNHGELLFGDRELSTEEARDFHQWPVPVRRQQRKSAVVVGKSPWIMGSHPSEYYGVILLDIESAAKLAEIWTPIRSKVLNMLSLDYVAVEMSSERARAKRDRISLPETFRMSAREEKVAGSFLSKQEDKIVLIFAERTATYLPERYVGIVARSLDELFSELMPQPSNLPSHLEPAE